MMFIYVFSEEDRDVLLSKGYKLMKTETNMWTFYDNKKLSFSENDLKGQFLRGKKITF